MLWTSSLRFGCAAMSYFKDLIHGFFIPYAMKPLKVFILLSCTGFFTLYPSLKSCCAAAVKLLAFLLAFSVASSSAAQDMPVSEPGSGGTCMPSVTAPPCAQGDAAGVGANEPSLNMGVGNPVHLATGAKQQTDIDLAASIEHPDMEIVRHYNSLRPGDSPIGTGWRFSYDTRVVVRQDAAQIEQANGARIVFDPAGSSPQYGTLRPQAHGWQWVWNNGRTLDFDAKGNLVRLRDGATVTDIVRHQGELAPAIASVRSGTAQFSFHYRAGSAPARLAAIDTPAGRFTYALESLATLEPQTSATAQANTTDTSSASNAVRLTTLTRPDGMQRVYLYEAAYQSGNAQLPTGVVLVQPARAEHAEKRLRISAWDYDAYGRAIGVALGERDAKHGYSHIHYLRTASATHTGRTRVDGPAGQTRFTFALIAGTPRLLTVEGAPCPACAPPGTRATYDAQGRLRSINGTRIVRAAGGQMIAVEPQAPGWPGLRITTSATGARRQWQSSLTGVERTQTYPADHTAVRHFANGDRMDIVYNDAGRLLAVRESRPEPGQSISTKLHWNGAQLHCVQHPHATELQHYDAAGHLTARTELRRLNDIRLNEPGLPCETRLNTPGVWGFTERFVYDAQGRMTTHFLPEGGAIHTIWGEGAQVQAITWEDAAGTHHPVIVRVADQAGYRYGNGLHLSMTHTGQAQTSLILADAQGDRWRETRVQNARGLALRDTFALRAEAGTNAATPKAQAWSTLEDWHYAYDRQDRMIGAQQAGGAPLWFAWHDDGALAASAAPKLGQGFPDIQRSPPAAEQGFTQIPTITRDPSGLPKTLGHRVLTYSANRRLSAVTERGSTLALYTHNAWGQRIRADTDTHITDYLYLGNRRVAEARRNARTVRMDTPPLITRRYLYAHDVPVGMIVYPPKKGSGELYAIHADLLGAPRMVTDAHARVRWLAHYTPLGQAERIAGDLTLDMRLPGQWYDAETGWHDNLLRTYHPQWGQYLEPDPLGPIPGTQALGYAAQQPRRFIDPLGLILFAFDGTRNNERTNTNVIKFLRTYEDGPSYYHSGPGNPYLPTLDAALAYSAPRILDEQWKNLLTALKQSNVDPKMRNSPAGAVPIDLIGFSRGAALARHFGNMILAQTHEGLFSYQDDMLGLINACVDLRFMGLYDTVAQFGAGFKDRDYDFSVGEPWRWVAHAVALHEFRLTFPLTTTEGSPNTNIIEAPFIGVHSDIGGGDELSWFDNVKPRDGDLSDVALNWMWGQAEAAGVRLIPLSAEDQRVREAILNNDTNPAIGNLVPGTYKFLYMPIDRYVLDAQSHLLNLRQDSHAALGETQRRAVFPLIDTAFPLLDYLLPIKLLPYADIVLPSKYTVDMHGYAAWLKQELGWNTPIQY